MNLERLVAALGGLKRYVRIATRILAALAILYVLRAMAQQWDVIAAWRPSNAALALLAAAVVTYAASLTVLAEVWHRLVRCFAEPAPRRPATYGSFVETQLAKYLPGNVFHLVGRYLWLEREGVRHKALVLASLAEIALFVLAALLVGAAAALLYPFPQSNEIIVWIDRLAPLAAFGALLACGLGVLVVRRAQAGLVARDRIDLGVLATVILACVFFLHLGAVFYVIGAQLWPSAGPYLIAAGALAWLAGFVTPGAPGGIGMREFALLMLLSGVGAEADVLLAAALLRVVTVAGEVLFYFGGRLALARARPA